MELIPSRWSDEACGRCESSLSAVACLRRADRLSVFDCSSHAASTRNICHDIKSSSLHWNNRRRHGGTRFRLFLVKHQPGDGAKQRQQTVRPTTRAEKRTHCPCIAFKNSILLFSSQKYVNALTRSGTSTVVPFRRRATRWAGAMSWRA
jgi:hypothetical protein